jgi:hypothetical protein
MNLDDLLRYVIWIAFFIIAFSGLYFVMRRIGVL